LKLLVLENGDKYILRGSTRIADGTSPAVGGSFSIDPSFKDGPPAFLKHAKSGWLKVREHDASANAGAKPCTALPWSAGDAPSAKVSALTGKLTRAEGTTIGGVKDKYFVVSLDVPVCSVDGTSQSSIQVMPADATEAAFAATAKLDGKKVKVSGDAEEALTSRDHLPIVVRGTITAP
jgi:hypothetical protein